MRTGTINRFSVLEREESVPSEGSAYSWCFFGERPAEESRFSDLRIVLWQSSVRWARYEEFIGNRVGYTVFVGCVVNRSVGMAMPHIVLQILICIGQPARS